MFLWWCDMKLMNWCAVRHFFIFYEFETNATHHTGHERADWFMWSSRVVDICSIHSTIIMNEKKVNGKKRKKVMISVEEKYAAIWRLDQGEAAVVLSADLSVGESTLTGWKENRAETQRWCSTHAGSLGEQIVKHKSMKKSELEEVSEAFFILFIQGHEERILLSGPIFREKAVQIYFNKKLEQQPECDEEKFAASNGWLSKWKRRHNNQELNVCGENLSRKEELPKFKCKFHGITDRRGLTAEQVYNCDETGLNFSNAPF